MEIQPNRWEFLTDECEITTSRSSGPGGQHVNKTETRVSLRFDVLLSNGLSEVEKSQILDKLKDTKLSDSRYLIVHSQEARSQLKNKKLAFEKMIQLLEESLKVVKPRKKTRPPKSALVEKRQEKERISQLKSIRGNLKNKLNQLDE